MNIPLQPSNNPSHDDWTKQTESDRDGPPGPWGFRMFLVFMLASLTYAIHSIYQSMVIDTVEPLGPVLKMGAAPDKASPLWLVETAKGYYPLGQPVSLEVGAKLILVTKRSGNQFLCNEDHSVCVSTSKAGRHLAKEHK